MNITPRQQTAIRLADQGAADWVPHITLEDVQELAAAAQAQARGGKGERDALLIQAIFDGCFRVSEALQLSPSTLHQNRDGWAAWITGKGGKRREVALSASIAAMLQAYAYRQEIPPAARIFPIDKSRVFRIVDRAFNATGIQKPPHVGTVHVLRHSGAIARLAATGNPKAIQDQLGHASARMTLRYLKTLTAKESLRINQGVDWKW